MNTDLDIAFASDMDRLLESVDRLVTRPDSGSVSFAVDEAAASDEDTRAELEAFLARITDDILHFAVLRTGSTERPAVGTWVAWSGGTDTVLRSDVSAAALAEHARQLQRQLQGRRLRLRMLATTAAAAARIASLSAVPGGALLALPVAWRYVRSMSEQWNSQLNA